MIEKIEQRLIRLLNKIKAKQLKAKMLEQQVYILLRKAEILEKKLEHEKTKESKKNIYS